VVVAVVALSLSIVSVLISVAAAVVAWRLKRLARDLGQRYADAIGLIAAIAHVEPPVAAPEVRAKCLRLLDAHHVEVTCAGGTVH
jgi:hypothetical protein